MSEDFTGSKPELRRAFRSARRSITVSERGRSDRAINELLLDFPAVRKAKTIAGYCAFDGEPDIAPALKHLIGKGRRVALPVIRERSAAMQMHTWDGTALEAGPLGISAPAGGEVLDPSELDALLIPLVAWDDRGGRLGMGGGYYDRYLAPLRRPGGPALLGVAYSLQQCRIVPTEPHDVRLHAVICENGAVPFETPQ
ncbi:MAG: 5-formyltetrahydrofolate cyclo-ligase [Xanthomonadales bacterium]|nr:5-formyltetrahydrofolate cyclo-ligase [Xanthomonadales bacterium]